MVLWSLLLSIWRSCSCSWWHKRCLFCKYCPWYAVWISLKGNQRCSLCLRDNLEKLMTATFDLGELVYGYVAWVEHWVGDRCHSTRICSLSLLWPAAACSPRLTFALMHLCSSSLHTSVCAILFNVGAFRCFQYPLIAKNGFLPKICTKVKMHLDSFCLV